MLNSGPDVTDGHHVYGDERDPDDLVTQPVGLWRRMMIRLRYRHITDPGRWTLRVRFDEIVDANVWDLAANADELNERYVAYSDIYSHHMPNRRRSS